MTRDAALRALAAASLAPLAACDSDPAVRYATGSIRRPTGFGAQVYEGDDVARSVALIAGCGGRYVRVSSQVSTAYLDALVGAAAARGLRVILLSPYAAQPVDVNAYAANAAAMQLRYCAANPIWEIWNEPNLAQYWGAAPNVTDYLRLLSATAGALRAVGASDVWTGGTSGVDLNWIYNLAVGGAFRSANGCAVHSYKTPGFARTEYIQAVSLVPAGVSIHTTEACVATGYGDQVDFFRQMWYLHRELNVPTMIWCELRDGSAGAHGPDSYPYGLVTSTYAIKTVYEAAAASIAADP